MSNKQYQIGDRIGEWELFKIDKVDYLLRKRSFWRHSCGYEVCGCGSTIKSIRVCKGCGKKLEMETSNYKKHTLCWTCQNFAKGCEWSESRGEIPVPGWTAEPSNILETKTAGGKRYTYKARSHCVKKCPKYKRDKPRTRVNIYGQE